MKCVCESLVGEGVEISPKCLGDIWLFEHFDIDDIKSLDKIAIRKTYSRGQAVFNQGDRAHELFIIKVGRIKLTKVFEDGREITLDYRKAGDTFGENMFSENIEYPATAWCLENTLTCGFTKENFEKLIMDHPGIGLLVIRKLSQQIAALNDRLGNMAFPHLEERLYRVILSVAQEHGDKTAYGITMQFPLTHEDLSFLTGAHRVSITKALKNLEKSNKIVKKGKTLFLPFQPMVGA